MQDKKEPKQSRKTKHTKQSILLDVCGSFLDVLIQWLPGNLHSGRDVFQLHARWQRGIEQGAKGEVRLLVQALFLGRGLPCVCPLLRILCLILSQVQTILFLHANNFMKHLGLLLCVRKSALLLNFALRGRSVGAVLNPPARRGAIRMRRRLFRRRILHTVLFLIFFREDDRYQSRNEGLVCATTIMKPGRLDCIADGLFRVFGSVRWRRSMGER